MGLTLYYAPMSSATRVRWALEELELPYDKIKVDLAAGEQRTAEFLALNPNGKVPLLLVDGVPIYESLAILLYLGDLHGAAKGLFPAAGDDRALAYRWICWGSVSVYEALVRLLRNASERFPAEERHAPAATAARKELGQLLELLDRELAGKEFLLGGFSLADLSIAAFLPLLMRLGVETSHLPALTAWSGRCMSRPALGRAMVG